MSAILRPIAIYLPQFHPTPENDKWWGKGFTEWTNVTKAQPRFKGHYQPHLPADLGFYDLRVPETREAQAALAKEYGIYGFCYYHYWFNGRRILERPFQEVFESGKPDFPFMLCWANEDWIRSWDDNPDEALLEQKYSPEDDLKHIQTLIPYFKDERYIKVDGKPVFAIYRSSMFPDMEGTIKIWREEAARQGLELYIVRFESCWCDGPEYMKPGFDAAVKFPPHSMTKRFEQLSLSVNKYKTIVRKLNTAKRLLKKKLGFNPKFYGRNDYQEYLDVAQLDAGKDYGYKCYPTVMPNWDNTARRKDPYVIKHSTPELFQQWTEIEMRNFKPYSPEENFIFINAWNEWAEGNHLEPDRKWGRGYLEAFKKATEKVKSEKRKMYNES